MAATGDTTTTNTTVYRYTDERGEHLSEERATCGRCGVEGWRGDWPDQGGIVVDTDGKLRCDACAITNTTRIGGTEVMLSRLLRDGDEETIQDALSGGEESGTIHDDDQDEEGLRWEVVPCGSSPACLTAGDDGAAVEDEHGRLKHLAYPREVARDVALRRPDLASGDAISTVLTTDPTLTATEVIDLLDEAAEGHRLDVEHEASLGEEV